MWMWRFWLATPGHGEMAIFDRSWNRRALVERVEKEAGELVWRRKLRDIADFERMLADDGCVFVKLFFHISKKEQKERYKNWEKDPDMRWKLDEKQGPKASRYDKYLPAVEEMLDVCLHLVRRRGAPTARSRCMRSP